MKRNYQDNVRKEAEAASRRVCDSLLEATKRWIDRGRAVEIRFRTYQDVQGGGDPISVAEIIDVQTGDPLEVINVPAATLEPV